MDAIVKIFKALFGGILGLFGGKKDGYRMDAGPVENAEAVAAVVAAKAAEAPAVSSGKKAAKTSGKKAPGKAEAQPTVAAKKAPTSSDPLDLINAALAASKVATEEAKAVAGGFADKYLIATPMPTRRPGANMAMFKDMAKGMKRF